MQAVVIFPETSLQEFHQVQVLPAFDLTPSKPWANLGENKYLSPVTYNTKLSQYKRVVLKRLSLWCPIILRFHCFPPQKDVVSFYVNLSLHPVLLRFSFCSFCSFVSCITSELWGRGWSTCYMSFVETWSSYAEIFFSCVLILLWGYKLPQPSLYNWRRGCSWSPTLSTSWWFWLEWKEEMRAENL